MAVSTDIPKWKSITTARGDQKSYDTALKRLDMQSQNAQDATLSVLSTIETNITNITNGTTTVSAKWVAYTGPMWLAWWSYFVG